MTNPQQISTHFETLLVKILHVAGGTGEYDVSAFKLDKLYRVLATYQSLSRVSGLWTPMFLLEGPGGVIVEKVCFLFKVAEVS